jgi:hypothetical protein
MEDQILDIRFLHSQLHQAGVVVEFAVFQQASDEPVDSGTHGGSSHGRFFSGCPD